METKDSAKLLDFIRITALAQGVKYIDATKPELEKACAQEDYYVFFSMIGDKEVGHAMYVFTYTSFRAKRRLYLEDIFVKEKFRRNGIGKAIFNELDRIGKAQNCVEMEWKCSKDNLAAIKFYYSIGARLQSGKDGDWLFWTKDIIVESE